MTHSTLSWSPNGAHFHRCGAEITKKEVNHWCIHDDRLWEGDGREIRVRLSIVSRRTVDETRYRRWAGCVKANWTDADPRFPVTNAGVPAEGSFTPCCFLVLMQPILLTKQGHREFDKERNVVPD